MKTLAQADISKNNMGALLSAVIETIRVLNDAADRNDMGSPTILTLLTVAHAGGSIPQSQLEDRVGMTGAGISRSLVRLGAGSPRVKGLGLLQTHEDYADRRYRIVSLTDMGKKLMTIINKKAGKYCCGGGSVSGALK